jgi:hypothetical protein
MFAALIFAEHLAAVIIALMYGGGQYLESFAERRASGEMTALQEFIDVAIIVNALRALYDPPSAWHKVVRPEIAPG